MGKGCERGKLGKGLRVRRTRESLLLFFELHVRGQLVKPSGGESNGDGTHVSIDCQSNRKANDLVSSTSIFFLSSRSRLRAR